MQPIKNSSVREQIRLKNEDAVKSKKKQIEDDFEAYKKEQRSKCDSKIANIKKTLGERIERANDELERYNNKTSSKVRSQKSSKPKFKWRIFAVFAVIGLITGCTVAKMHYGGGISGGIFGAFIYIIIYFARIYFWKRKKSSLRGRREQLLAKVKNLNKQADEEPKKAEAELKNDIKHKELRCKKEISEMRENMAAKTKEEITAYEQEVEDSFKRFMGNPDQLSPIVDHLVTEFENIDYTPEYEPVIKLDLNFEVYKTQIIFNPDAKNQTSFDFYRQGFITLTKDSECEGLAKAVALLSKAKMEENKPVMLVSFEQVDGEITMHTKEINPKGRLL